MLINNSFAKIAATKIAELDDMTLASMGVNPDDLTPINKPGAIKSYLDEQELRNFLKGPGGKAAVGSAAAGAVSGGVLAKLLSGKSKKESKASGLRKLLKKLRLR